MKDYKNDPMFTIKNVETSNLIGNVTESNVLANVENGKTLTAINNRGGSDKKNEKWYRSYWIQVAAGFTVLVVGGVVTWLLKSLLSG